MKDNLTLSNILARPMRTFTSVLGIAIGVFLIISTTGLANGTLRSNARREANIGAEIMVRSLGSIGFSGSEPLRLTVEEAQEIAKIEGVKYALPLGQNLDKAEDTETGSRLIDGVNFDQYAEVAGLQIVEGRKLHIEGNEAVIDTAWQTQKSVKIGSTLKIYEKEFTIVGTYNPPSGARIKIPLKTMQQQLLDGANKCTSILVKVNNPNQQEEIAKKIVEKLPDRQILLTRDFEELYVRSIPALDIFLNVVVGIAAIISILLILLTMYTTVIERTRQIGILKSLGMTKTNIGWTITKEALLISFSGFIGGVLLSFVLGILLGQTTSSMELLIEWKLIVFTLFGGLFCGAIGALYPAIRAAQLDAVEALNYE